METKDSFIDKIRYILANVSIKTYIYGIATIGVIIFIVLQTKNNTNTYLIKNSSGTTQCRDMYGNVITLDPSDSTQGCVDIFAAAKDFGINLSNSSDNSTSQTDYVNNTDNNLTNDISVDLIMTNLYLKQNGITDNVTRGKVLANITTRYINQVSKDKYILNDLNITRGEDADSYQKYYNDISNTLLKYRKDTKSNSGSINITKSKLNPDGSLPTAVVNQINQLKDTNSGVINSLISIPATQKGSEAQLNLINLFNKQNTYLDSLITWQKDPAKYLILNNNNDYFNKFNTDFNSNIDDLINYFKSLNITEIK
ncbi:MAG: hypothetical protein WCO35_03605 [Candidatus Nomurabacteria bacterium]